MAIGGDDRQARLLLDHPAGGLGGVDRLRLGIDDAGMPAAVQRIAGDQPAPQGRLDRGQIVAEILVDRLPAARVDQDEVAAHPPLRRFRRCRGRRCAAWRSP